MASMCLSSRVGYTMGAALPPTPRPRCAPMPPRRSRPRAPPPRRIQVAPPPRLQALRPRLHRRPAHPPCPSRSLQLGRARAHLTHSPSPMLVGRAPSPGQQAGHTIPTLALAPPLAAALRAPVRDPTTGAALTRLSLLDVMVAAMFIIALVAALFTFLGGLLTASIGQRTVYQLRVQIFDHIQRLSISFHKRSRTGDLAARLTSDIQSIQDMVSSGLNNLITNTFSIVGVLVVVAVVDWRFALLMVGATPLLLVVAGSYRARIRQASRRLRKAEGQVGATAQEKISAIQVVQAFANEDDEIWQFAQQTRQSLNAGLEVSRLQSELSPLVDLVGVIALAAITWLGAREVIAGRITLGYLLLFTTYLRSILSPARQLAKLSSQYSKAHASAERIQELLDIQPDVRDLPGARPAPRLRGAVAFEGVLFGYNKDAPVLRDIRLRVEPGMTVALVGPTGSGKSTLISLVPRFHDPQPGRVLLNGIDVRRFTLRSLRDQISLVLQEPVLFTGTIRDNIAYGGVGGWGGQGVRAAQAAHRHQLGKRLHHDYGTVVGPGR